MDYGYGSTLNKTIDYELAACQKQAAEGGQRDSKEMEKVAQKQMSQRNYKELCDNVLDSRRIHDLVHEVDARASFDAECERALLDVADDFVDHLLMTSLMMARHRGSTRIEARDMYLALDMFYPELAVPGAQLQQPANRAQMAGATQSTSTMSAAGEGPGPSKRSKNESDAHKQRMALIKRSLRLH